MKDKKTFYNLFWRWHFYAALFITPLLITLTISGIGYLFYTDVEDRLYDDYFFGTSTQSETLTVNEGIANAEQQFTGYTTSKIIVLDEPYNLRLTMQGETGDSKYVFLDNNNQIVGSQDAASTYSNTVRDLHSSLLVGGTFINHLVELAACWAFFLLLSGLYMTFKGKILRKPATTPRLQKRRQHALFGAILSIPIALLILTGLPWSAYSGKLIYGAAQNNPSIGFPTALNEPPQSNLNELPWLTRDNAMPNSISSETTSLSIEEVIAVADTFAISKPFTIVAPRTTDGVFTIAKTTNSGITGLDDSPSKEVTAYIDQYSGDVLGSVHYADYGILAKFITWGIPLHEGHLFGWVNKLINLLVCLGFLAVIYFGFATWLKRKMAGKLSAPPQVRYTKNSLGFIVLVLVLGILMPLFGLSLLLIALIEGILYFIKIRQTPA